MRNQLWFNTAAEGVCDGDHGYVKDASSGKDGTPRLYKAVHLQPLSINAVLRHYSPPGAPLQL